eukprot:1144500-Pelagomonas_calceolata.AAC.2
MAVCGNVYVFSSECSSNAASSALPMAWVTPAPFGSPRFFESLIGWYTPTRRSTPQASACGQQLPAVLEASLLGCRP